MKTLIVEDDFVSRRLLQVILYSYGECHIAVNGTEAVRALELSYEENSPYDLVCLDIMMPDMDGHEVLKRLNSLREKNPQYADSPKVVITSALGDRDNVFQAFRKQCDAYMVKPIEKEYFLAKLAELGVIKV